MRGLETSFRLCDRMPANWATNEELGTTSISLSLQRVTISHYIDTELVTCNMTLTLAYLYDNVI
jgi:hypothetical protein